MKTMFTILISIAFLTAAEPTGVNFLNIAVGARPASMAGAFVSIAEDIEAAYWNPAGLAQIENVQFTAMHLQWSSDIMYEFIAVANNFKNLGAFSASIFYLNLGNIDARDEYGQPLPELSAYGVCGMVSYGRSILDKANIGTSIKLFQEKIGNEQASSYAIDIGGLYRLDKVSFGLGCRNLGMKLKYIDEEIQLPVTAQAGVSYRPIGSQLILGLDLVHQIYEERMSLGIGVEYWIQQMVALRTGYHYQMRDDELSALNGLGAGIGMKHRQFGIDYGYEPSAELGDIHRISLKLNL